MATRIISAVVAIIFAVVVLMLNGTIVFNLTISAITALIIHELFKADKSLEFKISSYISLAYAFVTPIIAIRDSAEKILKPLTAIYILLMFLSYIWQYKKLKYEQLFFMTASTVFVTASMNCIVLMRNMGSDGFFFLLFALCGAWFADTGAYFTGTFFGKHKLCPNISPKKTVEGLIGGIVTDGILFVVLNIIFRTAYEFSANSVLMFFVGCISALLGTAGDLSASLIKRQCGIKDFGTIMPGHGGALDRFDSVLFVTHFMFMIAQAVI